MKTRQGFVSNSSSSSFIAAATTEAFEEALKRLKDPRDVKLIRAIATNEKIFGQKAKVVKEFSDAGGFSSIWGCDGDETEIFEKAGITWPPVDENGDELDEDAEGWYPHDCTYNYTNVLDEMATEKEWKDKIFQTDVGDGG